MLWQKSKRLKKALVYFNFKKMKFLKKIPVFALLLISSLGLMSQTVKKDTKPKTASPTAKYPVLHAVLGTSDYHNGEIRKALFDSLLKQGIAAKDSAGNIYKVSGFDFGYKERNLYEDSVGRLMIVADFYSEYCPGDTLTPALKESLYGRTKAGDTAYFENIKVNKEDKQLMAKSMKFIIVK